MKNQNIFLIFALMGILLMLTNSCEKDDTVLELNGTEWRWEGEKYNVYQAWTIVFTSPTEHEWWWGDSAGGYYQNKSVIGTYSIEGNKITFISSTTYSGTGSYTNLESKGVIDGNIMTIDSEKYTKIK
jgi:hypothetical protein